MAKRKAGAFAKRVGAGIKRGLTFKQAVQAAKGSVPSGKLKIPRIRRVRRIIMPHRRTRSRRRFSRRGTIRHSKPGITAWRVIKAIAIFGPPGAKAISDYQNAGGGMNGITKGVIPSLSTSYTSYNPNDGHFYPSNLVVGWAGPVAVAIAGKAGLSRLFRI